MLEFIPFIVAIVGLAIVFYMFRTLIVFIGDELANTLDAYREDTAHISKQLNQLQVSIQTQVISVGTELEEISANYRQTTFAVFKHTKEIIESLCKIEEAVNRQNELENEIVKLKSILSRKEKRHV